MSNEHEVLKPADSAILTLGEMLGGIEKESPSGLTDLPADFHFEKLDELCGGNYYYWGDEEGDRLTDVFYRGFNKGLLGD